MRKIGLLIVIAILAAAGFFFYKWKSPEKPKIVRNVLMITIDTLRADHLGVYGYAAAQTPNIDRLGAESALFENAIATIPLTLPSHSSIMSGVYPFVHGV